MCLFPRRDTVDGLTEPGVKLESTTRLATNPFDRRRACDLRALSLVGATATAITAAAIETKKAKRTPSCRRSGTRRTLALVEGLHSLERSSPCCQRGEIRVALRRARLRLVGDTSSLSQRVSLTSSVAWAEGTSEKQDGKAGAWMDEGGSEASPSRGWLKGDNSGDFKGCQHDCFCENARRVSRAIRGALASIFSPRLYTTYTPNNREKSVGQAPIHGRPT